MLDLIWIQAVCHSDGFTKRIFLIKLTLKKKKKNGRQQKNVKFCKYAKSYQVRHCEWVNWTILDKLEEQAVVIA